MLLLLLLLLLDDDGWKLVRARTRAAQGPASCGSDEEEEDDDDDAAEKEVDEEEEAEEEEEEPSLVTSPLSASGITSSFTASALPVASDRAWSSDESYGSLLPAESLSGMLLTSRSQSHSPGRGRDVTTRTSMTPSSRTEPPSRQSRSPREAQIVDLGVAGKCHSLYRVPCS